MRNLWSDSRFKSHVRQTRKVPNLEAAESQDDRQDAIKRKGNDVDMVIDETTTDSHFLQLTLDIPEKPLFRDEDGGLVIPQEPLVGVLKKFDGITFSDAISKSGVAQRKRYQLRKLPD